MICSNCGTQILCGKFCAKCGTKISDAPITALTDNFCPSCKAPLKPGAKFCRACGAQYEPLPVILEEPAPATLENPPVSEPEAESTDEQPVCGNCGAFLKSGVRFCRTCGTLYEPLPVISKESTPVVLENPPVPDPEYIKSENVLLSPAPAETVQPNNAKVLAGIPEIISQEPEFEPAVELVCVQCGTSLKPGAKFCRTCGSLHEPPPVVTEKSIPVAPDSPPPFKSSNYGSESGKKKYKLFVTIAAILLVIAAGIAIGYFFPRHAPNPSLPASLLVKTDPGNVYITLGGQPIGMTDDSGELLYEGIIPGLYEVLGHLDDYTEAKQSLQFTPGKQHEARLVLNRHTGNLSVNVNIRNADIRISGEGVYDTYNDQVTALDLPVGNYDVVVLKTGYRPDERTINIQANTNEIIGVTLEATVTNSPVQKSPLPARLLVKTEPGNVNISLDGRTIGRTNGSGELLYNGVPPGRHEILAYIDGYAEVKQSLQFTSGGQQEARLTLNRLTGNLSVKVSVGNADIKISGDGVLSDYNDHVSALELPVGSYTVTVSKAGYQTVTGTADIPANGNKNISVTLESTYNGPTSGVMVWEGDLRGSTNVTIENGKASTGRVTGNPLPGVPCSIQLSDYRNATIAYEPGPESDYKRVVLRVNSKGKVSVQLRWTVLR